MGRERWANMVRRMGNTRTRRSTLGGALLALTAAGLPVSHMEVEAKKKGKKKCKKCPPPQNPGPEQNCQEACPESCGSCIHRKVDSLICANGFTAGLTACSSDSDCVGIKFGDIALPYCATQTESRVNGQIDDIGNGNGVCTSLTACAA